MRHIGIGIGIGRIATEEVKMTIHVEELPVSEAFQDKGNRGKRIKELKELGFKVRTARMSSVILDSKYVKDYEGAELDKKYFDVIYIVEGVKEVKFRGV